MFTRHQRRIERMYGHGDGSITDSHRGYMNFGLWDAGIDDYAAAAENLVLRLGALLELTPGAVVLDAACGRGVQDLALLRRFGAIEIDAVDITARNLELARQAASSYHARSGVGTVRFHHASATNLPFPDRYFSHALCVEAAHHFDTRWDFAREAHRVLRPGGRLALAEIVLGRAVRGRSERLWLEVASALWGIPRPNLVRRDDYLTRLEACGFRIVSVEEVGARTFPEYHAAQRRPDRRRELVRARGRVGAAIGAAMNFTADKVYRTGLLDYLLVSAVRRA